jgi:hypothetical protein
MAIAYFLESKRVVRVKEVTGERVAHGVVDRAATPLPVDAEVGRWYDEGGAVVVGDVDGVVFGGRP